MTCLSAPRATRGRIGLFKWESEHLADRIVDQVRLLSFLDFDLGFFDQDEGRVKPAQNPFGPEKVLTMSPE